MPTLYRVVDEIAATLHSPPVDMIVIDKEYNASFGRYGWRGRRILTLGLPLFTILQPQERVALFGHELAHGINGDPLRSAFIYNAIYTLSQLYNMLRPDRILPAGGGWFDGIATILANLLLMAVTQVIGVVIQGLLLLIWHDSQRAEYLADALGAQLAGTDAALHLLDKIHLDGSLELAVQRAGLTRSQIGLMDILREKMASVPAREIARIRRVEALNESRLDTAHPPTAFRIQFLQHRLTKVPAYTLSETDSLALDAEFAKRQDRIQRELWEGHNIMLPLRREQPAG
jgi:heat shock protein HtpX